MVFSSIPFLYYFLPLVSASYFLVPKQYKNIVLFFSGILFYAWGEPKNVGIMMVSVFCSYIAGIQIAKQKEKRKKKMICILSVAVSLSFLIYYKYMGVFLPGLVLPIGISFYTFQIISYTIDVYRGEKAQKSFIDLSAYITMFPQLVAGPIVRYRDIKEELEDRHHSFEMAADGIRKFTIGLAKKVLLANQLGEFCTLFQNSDEKSVVFYWAYAAAYSLQIYFDFSGYSDMAIGLGKIFGFHFLENFNYPFLSRSITEFWRRWHISLGNWFRDYVYIPMGGNRVKKSRWFFNLFVVWFLTGVWHGASLNFVVWGLYFAILLIMEKIYFKKYLDQKKVLSRIYTLFFVMISFVIFNADGMAGAVQDIGCLFGIGDLPFFTKEAGYYIQSYAMIFLSGIVCSTPLIRNLWGGFKEKYGKTMAFVEIIVVVLAMVIITAFLVDGTYNPFLYFRF